MKAILYCNDKAHNWTDEFFPGYPAYLLPIGNKPFLEYIIEYCVLVGIRDVRIVTGSEDSKVSRHFREGTTYGINLSYATVAGDTATTAVIAQNRDFCRGDDLFFFQGLLFIGYNKNEEQKIEIASTDLSGEFFDIGGYFVCGRDRLESLEDGFETSSSGNVKISAFQISSIKDYFDWNMRVVYKMSANYNLPGYSESHAFLVGRNVQIPKTTDIRTPVIFGNSVQCGNNAKIGPGVIIGDVSMIDNDVNIRNTIVFGNSYIGSNLEIEDKICYRNLLIDPKDEIKIDIIDEFVLTELVKQGVWKCPITQRIIAFFLLIFQFIPFILIRPFLKIRAVEVDCFMNQQRKRKLKLRLYISPPESFACRYFMKFSLDRYHLLPLVLSGTLRLVGSYILEATEDNAEALKQFPDYAPGIFSYSEFLGHDNDKIQREIDEMYYMYHATFWNNFRILKGILIRNLLKLDINKQLLRY